jgi:hypothetical protein
MFAKLAKLAEPRAIESRGVPGARRLIHSRDNQRSIGPTTATQQNRRQVLVCHWHSGLGNGRLECSWHIEPGNHAIDEGSGERADAKPVAARRLPARI